MAVITFPEVRGHDGSNIRKILEMAIFAKPVDDVADVAISTIWTATGGLNVPVGYVPVGLITKDDGASWSRDQESSDVTSYGYSSPMRRDILSDVTGLSFTMQESKRQTMEMFHGLDLSAINTDVDGNFFFDKASRPAQKKYRILALGKDGDGPTAIYQARWLPEAQITENGEQAWSEGDEIKYPATLTAYNSSKFGTSMREIWGGPGLKHVAMGFKAPGAP